MEKKVIKIANYPYPDMYYTISDEEIKDGDVCLEVASFYPTGLPKILQCKKRRGDEMEVEGGWVRRIKWPNGNVEMKKVIKIQSESDYLEYNSQKKKVEKCFEDLIKELEIYFNNWKKTGGGTLGHFLGDTLTKLRATYSVWKKLH